MGLFDRLKETLSANFSAESEAQANSLDIESINGLLQEARALGFCMTHLCLDGALDIYKVSTSFCPSLINNARTIYMMDFDPTGLDVETIQNALRHEWLMHYGEALFVQHAQQHGHGAAADVTQFSATLIDDLNDALCAANKSMFDSFCSYMGYRGQEMNPTRVIDCVDYAIEHGLSDGKELTHWFPIANAMIDDGDDAPQKTVAPTAP
ncbi:MAG: hypothetical protein VX740_01335 [Pseudomonadota bacterium]|nr:hypothetical protein [Alphaproteobacteria bacterium]MEC7575705.1 hypothetical protein [Pseudomonadota bacterium]MCS5596584.1 hypothetical protein [Alphaproteobacteria bacterium]MEC7701670.1 hypothetical protein [Pseudomonadota bacterium]MEC9236907.1 hypothetical protein [Pseudomonadota bacterium]